MGIYNDFSQLKKFKPAAEPAPKPVPPAEPEDRALTDAGTSTDYFASLLGGSERKKAAAPGPRRTTVVTPATVARVREEQAEDARAAERAAAEAREAELKEEAETQKAVSDSLAADLAAVREDLEDAEDRVRTHEEINRTLRAENAALRRDLEARAAAPAVDADELEAKDREIARLQALLAEAQRTSLSSSVLLEKPSGFSEKFVGELREHVVETLAAANEAAEAGGRDRRARILEAVLGANPPSGELERRREAVKQIVKDADSKLDNAALAALEGIGFRYISGNRHHKLEWAGIRFPLAKTPSDYRACLNSAAEIANRVF